MPGSLQVSSKLNANRFHDFFIKDLNTIKQNKTKNIISRLINARKKEPDHVKLNDLSWMVYIVLQIKYTCHILLLIA